MKDKRLYEGAIGYAIWRPQRGIEETLCYGEKVKWKVEYVNGLCFSWEGRTASGIMPLENVSNEFELL